MNDPNIAHIRESDNKTQSVSLHCENVATLASEYSDIIGASNILKLAGLLHDAGKRVPNFQDYIKGDEHFKRGDIDHCFVGAKYILTFANNDIMSRYTAKLIAHIILSHHSLHDWLNKDYEDYCLLRTSKTEQYSDAFAYLKTLFDEAELKILFEKAVEEYKVLTTRIKALVEKTANARTNKQTATAFYNGLLERFLQSCLVDADRTDTANFMLNTETKLSYDLDALWEQFDQSMESVCTNFQKKTDPISMQRCDISNRCAAFANHNVRICRLIVPTGGGKTLSSLRFAIKNCKWSKKKKIIYTAPFMSILEQNSDNWRDVVGEEYLTEHHSNILSEIKNDEELHAYELRTTQWDTPVITTTMVQLLNTLFSDKMSCVRRYHTLSESVIIIDEIQSLPLKCVYMFNLAMNFFAYFCKTTIVLCSATQPSVEEVAYPLIIDDQDSITGDTTHDFNAFKRTEVIPAISEYGMSLDETADFCAQKFNENLLVIVNTKTTAKKIAELLAKRCKGVPVIHLSTNLCPAHRTKRINEIKTMLEHHKPVICVTTQLIEAGVDISFKCVVRSLTGLDSIAQAAGRCNRNKENDTPCPVYVVYIRDENVGSLTGVRASQRITMQLADNPAYTDYLSYETQAVYFKQLYQQHETLMSYPNELDRKNPLLELLSLNYNNYTMLKPKDCSFICQAFQTAGELFDVIDTNTRDIIVPFDKRAKKLISYLDNDKIPIVAQRKYMREVQKYTVSVFAGQLKKLLQENAIQQLATGALALNDRFYTEEYGIIADGVEQETLIM